MSSPGPLITILVTYLYFCISAGPRYMRDRKPFDLKLVIQGYNALQIVLSIYLVYLVSSTLILVDTSVIAIFSSIF